MKTVMRYGLDYSITIRVLSTDLKTRLQVT